MWSAHPTGMDSNGATYMEAFEANKYNFFG